MLLQENKRKLEMPQNAPEWAHSRGLIGLENIGWEWLADREGFEPSIPFKGYDDLANRCLQPLGHLSGGGNMAAWPLDVNRPAGDYPPEMPKT